MKLLEVLNKKILSWNPEDSCDVWISESGKVFDLGFESCHLAYINESFINLQSCEQLVNRGWIELTNTRDSVSVRGLNRVLAEYKGVWMDPILAKAKLKNIIVRLNIVGKCEANFELPKDQIKFLTIV